MDIGELISRDAIVARSGVSSKRQALHLVADVAAGRLGIEPARVMEALLQREALGSTGLGAGVAAPHARLAELDRVTGVFVRLEHPVAFDALDDRPVDLLFALFAPPSAGAEHLRALAAVSRLMRSGELREQLRQTRTIDGIHALLTREVSARAA